MRNAGQCRATAGACVPSDSPTGAIKAKYWLKSVLRQCVLVQRKRTIGSIGGTPRRSIASWNFTETKANLWKNSFHATEHALVAYITTSGVEQKPAVLHFALVNAETPTLRPYYYRANVASREGGTFANDGVKYRLVRAESTGIQ